MVKIGDYNQIFSQCRYDRQETFERTEIVVEFST